MSSRAPSTGPQGPSAGDPRPSNAEGGPSKPSRSSEADVRAPVDPFEQYRAEEELISLLLNIEGDDPSREMFSFLFDMLVQDSINASSPSTSNLWVARPKSTKPIAMALAEGVDSSNPFLTRTGAGSTMDILHLFLRLLVMLSPPNQFALLRRLNSVLYMHAQRMKAYCCQRGWPLRLMPTLVYIETNEVTTELVQLLQTLTRFSMTSMEMKILFRMMVSLPSSTPSLRGTSSLQIRPRAWPHLLSILQEASSREGPDVYLDANGKDAGLVLPAVEKWPAQGYALAVWVRIESFEEAQRPSLFYFLNGDGLGLEIYFEKRRLVAVTKHSRSKVYTYTFTQFEFHPKKWYFVCLSHEYHFLRTSEITLCVNGVHVGTDLLQYPKGDHVMARCRVGDLFGQIGHIVLFQEFLSPHDMNAMYDLGWHMAPSSRPAKDGPPFILGHTGSTFNFSPKKSAKIWLAYDPRLNEEDGFCTEASTRNKVLGAIRGAGTRVVRTHSVGESLYCVAGIKALFPLFLQLDYPIEGQATRTDEDMSGASTHLVVQLLSLLAKTLFHNHSLQLEMIECNGVPVLGHLMHSLSPACWASPEVIAALDALASSFTNPLLFNQFVVDVYFNFGLWVRTPDSVQDKLIEVISEHVRNRPVVFRTVLSVQRVLDTVRDHYWIKDEDHEPSATKGHRLGLLKLIKLMTKDGPTLEETKAMLLYAQATGAHDQGIDVLQLMLSFLAAQPSGQGVPPIAEHLMQLGGALPFIGLLQRPVLALRLWSLKIIGRLWEIMPDIAAGQSSQGLPQRPKLGSPVQWVGAMKKALCSFEVRDSTYHALLEILLGRISSTALKNPLSSHRRTTSSSSLHNPATPSTSTPTVSTISRPSTPPHPAPSITPSASPMRTSGGTPVRTSGGAPPPLQASSSSSPLVPIYPFKNPAVLSAIFEILCVAGDANVQRRALSDILGQLGGSPDVFPGVVLKSLSGEQATASANRDMILANPSWPVWLLGLIATVPAQMQVLDSPRDDDTTLGAGVFAMVMQIFQVLLMHSLTTKEGWAIMGRLQVLLAHFEQRGFLSREHVERSLNTTLLHALVADPNVIVAVQRNPAVWDNIVAWAGFLENFLLLPHTQAAEKEAQGNPGQDPDKQAAHMRSSWFLPSVHRSEAGMWIDFAFTQKLLDFLDKVSLAPKAYPTSSSSSTPSSSAPLSSSSSHGAISSSPLPKDEALTRLVLQATLITLYETDAFHNTSRVERRRTQLKRIEEIVYQHGEVGKSALTKYMQEKMQGWTVELSRAENIFSSNLRRLRELFESSLLVSVDTTSGRIMYILGFLYHAMKRSYDSKGMGAEVILALFKSILGACQPKLLVRWHPDFVSMTTEDVVHLFMTHLAYPERELPPMVNFDLLLQRDRDEELVHEQVTLHRFNMALEEERLRMERDMGEDAQTLLRVEAAIDTLAESQKTEETTRRERVARYHLQKPRLLSRMWRKMYRAISHERGPWAPPTSPTPTSTFMHPYANTYYDAQSPLARLNPAPGMALGTPSTSVAALLAPAPAPTQSIEVLRWKLDKTENTSRMRRRMTRNYRFNAHEGCAKPKIEAQQQAVPLTPIRVRISRSSEEDMPPPPDGVLSPAPLAPTMSASSSQEEITAHEDNEIPPEILYTGDKPLFDTSCELISAMYVTAGKLEISATHLYFIADKPSESEDLDRSMSGGRPSSPGPSRNTSSSAMIFSAMSKRKDRQWRWRDLRGVHMRRFLLRATAIELFLDSRKSLFFNLPSPAVRDRLYKKILGVRPPHLLDDPYVPSSLGGTIPSAAGVFKRSGAEITRRWMDREISNFDYLMYLNTIAGRTYNDLTQYPVFPWIIADYTSPTLDLNNPAVYRDLTKPVGALNQQRLRDTLVRYSAFEDPVIPKFHYGSHYSSIGVVLYYLVRMEPYTSHFLHFQGGKFDHPDRMFGSIRKCWENCMTNQADVKELIPEFFYQPEFLSNNNSVDFGFPSSGDVVLPPWAASPEAFVRINREALESEYVSQNLHSWIDLIFGYKQRGQEAIDAHNVFYYLTYEGVVDLESVDDPMELRSIQSQIYNFGQTPAQLTRYAHPKRNTIEEIKTKKMKKIRFPSFASLTGSGSGPQQTPYNYTVVNAPSPHPLTHMSTVPQQGDTPSQQVVMMAADGTLSSCTITLTPGPSGLPFSFEMDKSTAASGPLSLGTSNPKVVRRVEQMISNQIYLPRNCFAIAPDGRFLVSCGDLDCSFQFTSVATGKVVKRISKHRGVVTCAAFSLNGSLVTGSVDHTLLVWDSVALGLMKQAPNTLPVATSSPSASSPVGDSPLHTLYGHDDIITCVAVNSDLDIVASGSRDMTCIVHTLYDGRYLRTLTHDAPLSRVLVSREGDIACYSRDSGMLRLYTINGTLLGSVVSFSLLEAILFSANGKYLVTGTSAGQDAIVVRSTLPGLEILHQFECDVGVRSLVLVCDDKFLMAALQDGRVNMFEFTPDRWPRVL
eukprot:TRINITY_DN4216_c0_g1_i3.p1 TRINITY_DN4216_c0_g1~~TRINITY_DN4216_c0_g1_i3.p1  ORF type:complete len:2476 (+),score=625.81 TRINITY_DN4216_c0_g1_i3:3-7430(+)